jgi:hypothetical protein
LATDTVIEDKVKIFPVDATKTYKKTGGIAPFIRKLGTRLRSLVNFTPRTLYPRQRTPVLFEYDAGWAPEPVWTFLRR